MRDMNKHTEWIGGNGNLSWLREHKNSSADTAYWKSEIIKHMSWIYYSS